jgi:multiple sugar transport system substrate-binding protein
MKKTMLVICILLLFVSGLSACAPAATPVSQATAAVSPVGSTGDSVTTVETATSAPAAEPVTITFWHTYNEDSPENEMLVQTLIPEFEAQFPNIKVESLTVPWPDFMRKLTTAIAGGAAPDLIRSDIVWVPQLADMGALVPLDSNMPDFNNLKDRMFPGPLSTNEWKGSYYGLPLDTNTKAWLYNPEMYANAGIQAAPKNISELEGQCEAFKAAYPEDYYFAGVDLSAWSITPWIWSMGGEILSPDLTTATGYLNGPKTVAAYEEYLKLFDNGCIAPLVLGNGVDAYTGKATDLYASSDDGPWTYPIVQGQYPDKVIASALFPAGEAGSIDVVGGEDIVMFQQSKHQQEAMEFMRFMVSDEAQLKMAEVGVMPVIADLANSDTIKNHPYFPIFMEQLNTSRARPALPQWNQIDEIIKDSGQIILRHEMTPQQALDDAAAQIDALLAQ